ncbi:hypothetical protein HFO58_10895 [Rhizobium leguminosarum]|uniref:FAD-dependent monooxygenase n=1 Tax=Rhizobium leguminosarum TaxID=384 RepID=UPI001C96A592|nr:FAD-dependent monooxygenase [Rhizobium leguminosarum]MBY5533666.1 hypothetical protein [Rhizobium leguminosarum]
MILIAGAGIAGLAMAKALELKGQACEIVERASHLPTAGAGIFLLGNATRVLERLNLLEEVEAAAHPILKQRIFNDAGSLLNEVATESVWRGCGPCFALSRQNFVRILASSLMSTEIQHEKSILDVEPSGGFQRVTFSDGSCSHYTAVIGADGIRSSLRTSLFDPKPPYPLGITCWRFVTENNTGLDSWTAMVGRRRTLLAIPISKAHIYVYADCPSVDVQRPSLSFLKKHFVDFAAPLGQIVSKLDTPREVHSSVLEEIPIKAVGEGQYSPHRRRRPCELPEHGARGGNGLGRRFNIGGDNCEQQRHN